MAETVLKFQADEKDGLQAEAKDSRAAGAAPPRSSLGARLRARRRLVLLVVIPAFAAVAGLYFYLAGGRYITTDNAYIGATKVLITPDISGKISRIAVREGQHVGVGDPLLEIDAAPFKLAVTQAQARVESVRTEFANLKTNLAVLDRQIALAQDSVALRQNEVDRKTKLLANHSGTQADLDTATWNLMSAKNQVEALLQQQATAKNQLLGDLDLPIARYPAYQQAAAALDQAERDLDHTVIRAPIAGAATQVDNVQLGRYVTAGTPILSVVDDTHPWVDANPKETDITYLKVGQSVKLEVDAFPNRTFRGVVTSVSPGTGAQFAILPPQNASGNWVKVVQRVPVRITFAPDEDVHALRAGMSVYVSIDSGHERTLAGLLGLSATAKDPPAQEPRRVSETHP